MNVPRCPPQKMMCEFDGAVDAVGATFAGCIWGSSGARVVWYPAGGVDEELRGISAEKLREIEFDGYAVGGLAVGEGQEAMFGVLDYAPDHAASR